MQQAYRRALSVFSLCVLFGIHQAGGATVSLAWGASDNADGYILKWGTESKNYTHSNITAKTHCAVSNLTAGVTYYFAVSAYNTEGESDTTSEFVWSPDKDTEPPPEIKLIKGTISCNVLKIGR